MLKIVLSTLGLFALVGAARSQDVVVPINQVFRATSASSPLMNTPFRGQMMYDNSHFISQGVTGPITINRLRFRGRDGVPNLGGQVFTNLHVTMYDSPTTSTVWLSSSTGPSSARDILSTAVLTRDELTSGFNDAQRCFSLTFTSGPNIGLTRIIEANGENGNPAEISVSVPFPSAPAVGDTFYVTRMPINYNNMAAAYAANVGANVGSTEVIPSVTVGPSIGTFPNNECVDLQLTTGAFTYDPTTMGNLVVELSCSTAPAPNATSLIDMAGSATAGIERARWNERANATAIVGSLLDYTAVIHIGFTGAGGHPLANVGATVLNYGYACGAQSSNVYQYFNAGPFDLRGLPARSLTFTPDSVIAPSNYTVTSGTMAVDLTQAVGPVQKFGTIIHTPGWAAPFHFVGGTTTAISASIKGFVWLANRGAANSDQIPMPSLWFGGGTQNLPARVAPLWLDFSGTINNLTNPGCGMYVNTDTAGGPGAFITYVTWKEVAENLGTTYGGGHSVNTFQCVFFEATGVIELRYGAMSGCFGNVGITGFTQGTLGGGVNSTDPGSRDLSAEVPLTTTGPNGPQGAMTLTTNARPVVGTSTSMTVTNIPASHTIGLYLFDFAPTSPGYMLAPIVDSACILSIPFNPNWGFAIDFIGPSPGTRTMAGWPGPAGAPIWPQAFVGAHLYVQYTSSAALLSGHATSNALDLMIGFN